MIPAADVAKLRAVLSSPRLRHELEDFRTSAIASLAWDAAVRPSEALALDVPDLVLAVRRETWMIRPWTSFADAETVIPYSARRACQRYLARAILSRWITTLDGPFFVARPSKRLSARAAQIAWAAMQQRAGLDHVYTFAELRADRLERAHARGGREAVAALGRLTSYNGIARYTQGEQTRT